MHQSVLEGSHVNLDFHMLFIPERQTEGPTVLDMEKIRTRRTMFFVITCFPLFSFWNLGDHDQAKDLQGATRRSFQRQGSRERERERRGGKC